MAVVGLDGDSAIRLTASDHEPAGLVVAERLQGGDDCRFAAVIWSDQNCQPLGRFDHRVRVRHEIVEGDAPNHSSVWCSGAKWRRRVMASRQANAVLFASDVTRWQNPFAHKKTPEHSGECSKSRSAGSTCTRCFGYRSFLWHVLHRFASRTILLHFGHRLVLLDLCSFVRGRSTMVIPV